MIFRYRIYSVLFLLLLPITAIYSQKKSKGLLSISGYVYEVDNPVEYASVVIKDTNDMTIAGSLTSSDGSFKITFQESGEYKLHVSFIGYRTRVIDIKIDGDSLVISNPIKLEESVNTLSEASVTAKKSERQTDIEKTKINSSSSIASSRGSLIELLKTASMVSIDNNNSISIRGNSNILILIDGIPSSVGSLDAIPASFAQSIEIITNPDTKYDSEGTGGIINIITRKDKMEGFSMASSFNYGINERFNGDLILSSNNNGWNLALSYSGKYNIEKINSQLYRYLNQTSNSTEQIIKSEQLQRTTVLTFNASKKVSGGDMLTFNVKYMKPEVLNNQNIININSTLNNTDFLNRKNEFHHIRDMGELIIEYSKRLTDNGGHISFRGAFSQTKGQRPAKYFEDELFIHKSEGGGYPTNYTFQADFFNNKDKSLEAGIKYFYRGNTFKFDSYQYDTISKGWLYNPLFSADLSHRENIISGYFNFTGNIKENLTYKLGLRTEYSESSLIIRKESQEIYYNNFFLSPYLLLRKNFSQRSSLSLSFSRRITRPAYPQINPYINMIDKSVYETGNRDIRPEEISRVELLYSFAGNGLTLNGSLFYNNTKGFITQISSLYQDDVLMLTYINGDKSIKIGSDLYGRYKLSQLLSFSISGTIFYGETYGVYNHFDLSSSSVMWSGNFAINLSPSKKSDISLQYLYNSAMTYPQFKSRPIHYLDLAVRTVIIKDKLTSLLTISDVFNTRRWDISSDNHIYTLRNNSKNQSRVVWVGLTFNINRMQIPKQQKRDEEQDSHGMIRLGY